MSALLDQAKKVVALAKQKGAGDARASAYSSREVEIIWRDGRVEKVSEATTRGVSVSLYVDGRYGSGSTSDLRPEALDRFVEESVAMARTLAKDPFRALPDPKRYAGRSTAELSIDDPQYAGLSAEGRRAKARAIEEGARGAAGASAIVSVEAGVSDAKSMTAVVSSNGFEGEREETTYWQDASVTCRDKDGRRPEESESSVGRFSAEQPSPAELGRRAAERALGTLGAAKIKSAVLPLVIENRAGARMVRSLLAAMTGRALQQKQSFLDGKLGKEVASKLLTITDDPLLPRGLASRHFDSDGFAAKKRVVFDKGVLSTFFIDDYYARKLAVEPTTATPTNLLFGGGAKALDALIAEIKEGILVTGFLGGNSNATTGDFSAGIQGYRISAGKRAEPIAEMNISANLEDFWKKLVAVGNDPWLNAAVRTPTLVFDGVQVAGL